jgi:hypothetical protein
MTHRLVHADTDRKVTSRAESLPVAAPVVPEDPQGGQHIACQARTRWLSSVAAVIQVEQHAIEVLAEQRAQQLRVFLRHHFRPLAFEQQLEGKQHIGLVVYHQDAGVLRPHEKGWVKRKSRG